MEAYIVDVEKTLSELTGEHGLGAKISSDVDDCFKLDLLEELDECHAVAHVAGVVDIMGRNTWNDVRIASAGIKKLRSSQVVLDVQGRSFTLHLLDSDGLRLLLQNMRQHPFHADLQRTAAEILLGVLERSSHLIDSRLEDAEVATETANCLVNILNNHANDDEFKPQQIALAALKAAAPSPDKRGVRAVVAAVAPAGGIPFLFDALDKFCREMGAIGPNAAIRFEENAQMVQSILNLFVAIMRAGEISCSLFFDEIRNRPSWRSGLNDVQRSPVIRGTEFVRMNLTRTLQIFLNEYVLQSMSMRLSLRI